MQKGFAAVFPALMISLAAAGPAFGQALDLAFDFNTPAADAPKYPYQPPIDVEPGLGWTFGYFGRGTFAEGGPLRWGALVGYKSVKVSPEGESSGYKYSALRFQGRGDIRLWTNRNFLLSGGLAAGVTFLSDNIPCYDAFCGLPSAAVVEVTPNLRFAGRISDIFSVFADVRGSLYLSDEASTFPYRSGAIFAVGVEVTAYVGKDSDGDGE